MGEEFVRAYFPFKNTYGSSPVEQIKSLPRWDAKTRGSEESGSWADLQDCSNCSTLKGLNDSSI